MDGAVFGSFSITEFYDLFDLNIRSNHSSALFFEVDSDGLVHVRQGKIDGVRKRNKESFMIGVLTDNVLNVTFDEDVVSYFESSHESQDIQYLIDTKKEFFYLTYENSKVTFTTTKKIRLHMSENYSFSTTPVNGYEEIKPNLIHSIPIFKDKKFITTRREYGT